MDYIAHRGASGYAPENTVESFREALRLGCRKFEFDVQLSRDGRLVVAHDYRLPPGALMGRQIAEMDFEEIRAVPVPGKFAEKYPKARVPSLEETLDILAAPGNWLNAEIKNEEDRYPGIEEKTLAALKTRNADFLISSFDVPVLERVRRLDEKIALGVLWKGDFKEGLELARKLKAASININQKRCSPDFARLAHENGLKLMLYTVNDKTAALELEKTGVDAVFTDFPDLRSR